MKSFLLAVIAVTIGVVASIALPDATDVLTTGAAKVGNGLDTAYDKTASAAGAAKNGIQNLFGSIGGGARDAAGNVSQDVQKAADMTGNALDATGHSIANRAVDARNGAENFAGSAANGFGNAANSAGGFMHQWISPIIQPFTSFFSW